MLSISSCISILIIWCMSASCLDSISQTLKAIFGGKTPENTKKEKKMIPATAN